MTSENSDAFVVLTINHNFEKNKTFLLNVILSI